MATTTLPTSDVTTAAIRSLLGLSGDTTFEAMCQSGAVQADGLNSTYCSGADAEARILNLQTAPYEIAKFRGYTHTYTLTIDNSAIVFLYNTGALCDGYSATVNVTATLGVTWTATPQASWVKLNGSSSPVSGSGNGSFTVSINAGSITTSSILVTSIAPTVTTYIDRVNDCGGIG